MSEEKDSKILVVGDQDFDEKILSSDKISLVDFWAPWCGPCKMLGPIVEEIANEVGEEYNVAKINVDDNPIIAGKYKIMSIPTMLIFKDGKIAEHLVGAQPKEEILKRLNSVK